MKPAAHGDLIIGMDHRPRSHPPTELIMWLDHDHRHTPLDQPNRRSDAGNAAAGHDDRPGAVGEPRRTTHPRMTDRTSITAGPPARASSPNDHETAGGLHARKVCRIPRCQPGTVRTSTSTKPARYKRSTKA